MTELREKLEALRTDAGNPAKIATHIGAADMPRTTRDYLIALVAHDFMVAHGFMAAPIATPTGDALGPKQRCPNCQTTFQQVNDVDGYIATLTGKAAT